MTARENCTKNLANRGRAPIRGAESFSTRIAFPQPGDHDSAVDAQFQIRSSWPYSTQTVMWAAIEHTQSHQVDGESAEVFPWRIVKELCHESPYRDLPGLPSSLHMVYETVRNSNRGGLALWLF